jgi:hypothetical protein
MLANPTDRFLLEFDTKTKKLINEYELPDNNIPFCVVDGVVHCSTFRDEVTINQIPLKNLAE